MMLFLFPKIGFYRKTYECMYGTYRRFRFFLLVVQMSTIQSDATPKSFILQRICWYLLSVQVRVHVRTLFLTEVQSHIE